MSTKFKPFSIFPTTTLLLIALILVESSVLINFFPSNSNLTLQAYADQVIAACNSEQWKPGCYDKQIPRLMDKISMEDAFQVVRFVQQADSKYLYCHVVAHELSYKEAQKDPDGWKDVITRCPSTLCNNGCLHGSMMERFNNESLTDEEITEIKPELLDICEPRGSWHPVEMERSMCYHGMGHLFMFMTSADITKSLALCEYTGIKKDGRNYVQTCSQGVYMILYQAIEPEDAALVEKIAPKSLKERDQLCSKFSDLYWESCMTESWPLSRALVMHPQTTPHQPVDFEQLNIACAYAKQTSIQTKCYETWLSMLVTILLVDMNDQQTQFQTYSDMCLNIPPQVKDRCFSFGAFRLVQIDPVFSKKALALCSEAEKYQSDIACYSELAKNANNFFNSGAPQAVEYCEVFPVNWRESCLAKVK